MSAGNLLIKIRQGANKSTVASINKPQIEESTVSLSSTRSDDEDNKEGQLIDLDHAKWVQNVIKPYGHGPPSHFESSDIRRSLKFGVESDVLELAWQYFGAGLEAAGYEG